MHGFGVFLAKELREIVRTWRIWVLPSIMVFIGLLGPVTAEITPALIESVTQAQQEITIEIPDPTTAWAYAEWVDSLTQIALIAIIISMAGMVAAERKSGTAVLVLTKPVSRTAMVVAKVLASILLLAVSLVMGAVVCWATTQVFFENELFAEFVQATALWFVLALVFVTLMALLSTAIKSQAGAAGAGLGVYVAMAILSAWGPGRDFSPAGLLGVGNRLLTGEETAVMWPVSTSLAAAVVLTLGAAVLFRRKEL